MPGVSIPNMSGAVSDPLLTIGEAASQAPVAAADQTAALEQKGWSTISPMIIAASRNPNLMNNTAFVAQLQRTAQMFRISGPLIDQAIQQTRDMLGGQQVGVKAPAPAASEPAGATQTGPAQPAQPGGGGATQTGPAAPAKSAAGTTPQLGQQGGSQQVLSAYQGELDRAARTPAITKTQAWRAEIMHYGQQLGKNSAQIAQDVKASQLKAGTAHPHDDPQHPAYQGSQPQASPQSTQAGAAQPGAGTAAPSTTGTTGQTSTQTNTSAQPQSTTQGNAPVGSAGSGAMGPTVHALPAAMQALMAAAGVAPTGMQAYGTNPIDGATSRAIAEASPATRPLLYANAGIDPETVPSSVMNAPQMMTEYQAANEANKTFNSALAAVKQGIDPTAMIEGAARAGAITADQAQAWLSDPNFLAPLQDAAQRDLQTRLDNNLISKARYSYIEGQIANQPNIQALTQARTKFLGAEQKWLNPLDQSKVDVAMATITRMGAMTDEEQSGSWSQQQQNQGLSLNQQVVAAQKSVGDLNTAYNNLLGIMKAAQNKPIPEDPSNIDVGGGVKLSEALGTARTELQTAKQHLQDLTQHGADRAASSAINTPNSGQRVKGESPKYGDPVARDAKGRLVYKSGSNYVYGDGSPYKGP